MEAGISTDRFVKELAARRRVLMLGGMAVIAHGLSRPTKDSDIWLDPMATSTDWAECLQSVVGEFPTVGLWSLPGRCTVRTLERLVADAEDFGVVRVTGLSVPLDVFRKPNELNVEDFDRVWADASPLQDGTRLPSELHLYVTKANTGREHDWQDQLFLESLVKKRFRERLPVCDVAEAQGLLDRFLDPECLQYALDNPDAAVREMALVHLREFEAEGDPYSRDILAAWRKKNPAG
jgi:hypothetical protein